MQALRKTIHIMLILAVISTGMPLYHSGDANRDGEVGLADAILRVRVFVKSADNSGSFVTGVEDLLTTLSVVAGFKKVIKSDRSTTFDPASSLESSYLITVCDYLVPQTATLAVAGSGTAYQSIILAPDHLPPRSV